MASAFMTTWVLLRGLAREARHWGDFPAVFRNEFPDADILTPDLPGNGRRFEEPSPTRVADMVAVDWAARHPEECRAAVLISPLIP